MRSLNILVLGVLVGLVFVIYDVKHDTRRLELRAAEIAREITQEQDNLAVMRAEWGLVTRPERVEAMARTAGLVAFDEPRTLSRADFMSREAVAAIGMPPGRPTDAIGSLLERGDASP